MGSERGSASLSDLLGMPLGMPRGVSQAHRIHRAELLGQRSFCRRDRILGHGFDHESITLILEGDG
jgi:hypothetical protein